MVGPAGPTYRPFREAPARAIATGFLAVVAVYLAIEYRVVWGVLLVLAEAFFGFLRPMWAALDQGVDLVRARLATLKRLPSALIALPLLFCGLYLGAFFPASVLWLANGVGAVVGNISKAAPFVIFFTLTPSIASSLAGGRAGKFALWVTSSYVILNLAAGLLAILFVVPIFGVRFTGAGAPGAAEVHSDFLRLLFTSKSFIAIFAAAGLALMIHGFRLGGLFALTRFFGGRAIDLVGDVLKILLPLVLFALGAYIPTNLSKGIERARQAGALQGQGWISTLSMSAAYFVTVGVLVLVLFTWIGGFSWLVMRYTKFPFTKFLRDYFLDVYAYAWATSSSNATMPLNVERAGDGLRVRATVREFIIPSGATVHLDGTMIGSMVTTVVAAQLVGYTPTVLDLLYVLLALKIVAVGTPGIPGGLAVVGAPVIANLLPLPPGSQAAFTAIFVGFNLGLGDQFRTGVNATGNGVLARLFEYWYPRRFERPAAAPLEDPQPADLPRPRRPRAQQG